MSDYARSVQILISIAGDPESRVDRLASKIDQLAGKSRSLSIGSESVNQMDRLTGSTKRADDAFQGAGNRLKTAFGDAKKSLDDLQGGVQNLVTSLAGIAVGGSISGLAWLDSAQTKLYNEQIKEAIGNNKKLGVTYDELHAKVMEQVASGEGTREDTVKELYSVMTMGAKYIGKGQDALNNADAITDFWFAHQEMMKQEGISSPEMLVRRAIQTSGKMEGRFGIGLATAMGLSPDSKEMRSAKSRMEFLMEKGSEVDMSKALEARPWEQVSIAMSRLKYAIGDSLSGPLAKTTSALAAFTDLLVKIPVVPPLIGFGAIVLAGASAISLMIGVLTPLLTLMNTLRVTTVANTAATWLHIGSKQAETITTTASTQTTLLDFAAKNTNTVATVTNTAATNTSILARLRSIAVKGYDTIATWLNTSAMGGNIIALGALAVAQGIATVASTLLGGALWFASAPLLPFVAAGLILVGVLGLLAAKAGILQPIMDGLGKAFKNLTTGNFKGAWADLTNIKLPTVQEMKTNLMSDTNLFVILDKYLGIPLWKTADFMSKVHDTLGKIKDIVYQFASVFMNFWNWLTKKLPESIKEMASTIISGVKAIIPGAGGLGEYKTTEQKAYFESRSEKPELPGEIEPNRVRSYWDTPWGNITENWAWENLGEKEIARLWELYNAGSIDYVPADTDYIRRKAAEGRLKTTTIETNAPTTPVESYYDTWGQKEVTKDNIKNMLYGDVFRDVEEEAALAGKEVPKSNAKSWLQNWQEGNQIIPGHSSGFEEETTWVKSLVGLASGGLITKSGLLIGHQGEPIIPAEVANSSRLQETLETLAFGSNTATNNTTINNNVDYYYTGSPNTQITMDKFAFERAVKEIIGKCTRQYGAY